MTQERAQKRREFSIRLDSQLGEMISGNSKLDFDADWIDVIEIRENETVIEKELLEKVYRFLDEDIGSIPANSRQRELDEDTWETAMFLRDLLEPVRNK